MQILSLGNFVYSLWKQLVWANRHGLLYVELTPDQQQARWRGAHNVVRSSTRKKYYYLREQQLKAALQKDRRIICSESRGA